MIKKMGKWGQIYAEKCQMPIANRSLLMGTVPDDIRKNLIKIIFAKSS
jgi:hypothetical protein